jgi:peptidoglycan/xylan/chitin deacetylase (PgdA/CDA1 family)
MYANRTAGEAGERTMKDDDRVRSSSMVVGALLLVVLAIDLLLFQSFENRVTHRLVPDASSNVQRQESLPPPAPASSSDGPASTSIDALHPTPRLGVTTVVSLTFDDGVVDQYALRGLMPASGLTATLYANSGLISAYGIPEDRMSLWALRDLAQHGVEIGGHSVDHPDLTKLSTRKARQEICGDRDRLQAMGFRAVSFAYPYSRVDSRLFDLPRSCGYLSARSVGGIACRGCPVAETFPPANPYSLRTSDAVLRRTRLSELKRQVRKAEESATATSPAWLILNFHHICNGCNRYAISEHHLVALLTWLKHRPPSTAVRAIGAVMLHGFE